MVGKKSAKSHEPRHSAPYEFGNQLDIGVAVRHLEQSPRERRKRKDRMLRCDQEDEMTDFIQHSNVKHQTGRRNPQIDRVECHCHYKKVVVGSC